MALEMVDKRQIMGEAEVVIIGGGVIGCSIAYHLTQAGQRDVILVERNELGSGTTSSSAGLLGQVRPTPLLMQLIQKTFGAIQNLEKELEESIAFHQVGSLRITSTPGQEQVLEEHVAVARRHGIDVYMIDKGEAQRLVPGLDVGSARKISYVPTDGFIDAYQLATAYARVARARGVTIWSGTAVTDILVDGPRVVGVRTDRGELRCRHVVDAAGAWAGPIASLVGIALPQAPVRSHFWITAPLPEVRWDQPVVRIPDARAYARPEVGGLLIGVYEEESRSYDARELPASFRMNQVDRDWEVLLSHLDGILQHFPGLRDAEMVGATAGLTTYTPDGKYLVGRVPATEGFSVASGCCGLGVAGSGGIGYAIAELLVGGTSSLDLTSLRADRFGRVDPYSDSFRRLCATARATKSRSG